MSGPNHHPTVPKQFNPWRAPGKAPVFDSCGMAGGRVSTKTALITSDCGETAALPSTKMARITSDCGALGLSLMTVHAAAHTDYPPHWWLPEHIRCRVQVTEAFNAAAFNTTKYAKIGDLGTKVGSTKEMKSW